MLNLGDLKKVISIGFICIFLFVSVVMPYGNFDDNGATHLLYNQQQEEDPDLTLGEFVFEKLLVVGELFDDDADEVPSKAPVKVPQPIQVLQIQAGFIEFPKPAPNVQEPTFLPSKPTCLFKETKFNREYSSPIFHPPSQAV